VGWLGKHGKIELIEQPLKFGPQTRYRNGGVRSARLAQQIDEHRHATAVAIVDGRSVDDDAPGRRCRDGGACLRPDIGDRIRVEPAAKHEDQAAVGAVREGQRRPRDRRVRRGRGDGVH